MSHQTQPEPIATWRKMVPPAIAGALASIFVVNTGWSAYIVTGQQEFGTSRAVALTIGAVYLCAAIGTLVAALSPFLGTKYIQPEETEDLLRQRNLLFSMAVAGLAFGGGACVLALQATFNLVPQTWLAAALLVVGWVASFIALRLADELKRRIAGDAALIGFCLLSMVGMGWAVLRQAGVLAPATPLDWVSTALVVGLFSLIASASARGSIKWW